MDWCMASVSPASLLARRDRFLHWIRISRRLSRPILKGAIVEQHGMAERPCGEEHRRRLLAHVTVTNDRVTWLHAGLGEQRRQVVRRLEEHVVVDDFCIRNALRARYVARALAPVVI